MPVVKDHLLERDCICERHRVVGEDCDQVTVVTRVTQVDRDPVAPHATRAKEHLVQDDRDVLAHQARQLDDLIVAGCADAKPEQFLGKVGAKL